MIFKGKYKQKNKENTAYTQDSHTIHDFSETKIGDFHHRRVVISKQNILRLKVAVCNAFIMDILPRIISRSLGAIGRMMYYLLLKPHISGR